MQQTKTILITVIFSILAAFAVVKLDKPETPLQEKQADTVYDRVTKTKILRCGYITWPPLVSKNVNTGKMEGLYVDLTEELAKGFGWKIDWKEEVPLTDFVTALQGDRVDMMCAPMAPVQQRTQWVGFSRPHFYAPYNAYVRQGDTRFDNNLQIANDPKIKLSTIEGELTSIVARTLYPKANVVELSAVQGASQLFENVITGKADIVFQDPFTFSMYNQSNPNKLQQVVVKDDIGMFYAAYALKLESDTRFRQVIDAGITEFIDRGYIAKLAAEYKLLDMGVYLPADGYKK